MTKADQAAIDAQTIAKERVYQAEKIKRWAALVRQPVTETQSLPDKVTP